MTYIDPVSGRPWPSWEDPLWYPNVAITDRRFRPSHHALLFAVIRIFWDNMCEYEDTVLPGEPFHFEINEADLKKVSRIRNPQSLDRHRSGLVTWRYLTYRQQSGRPSLYSLTTRSYDHNDWNMRYPVPTLIADDHNLTPSAVAAYLALAYAAHHQHDWTRDDSLEYWEEPTYATTCRLLGPELDEYAGFGHTSQRTRYMTELARAGHVRVAQKAHYAQKGDYVLLANEAADQAHRQALKEDHERMTSRYEEEDLTTSNEDQRASYQIMEEK